MSSSRYRYGDSQTPQAPPPSPVRDGAIFSNEEHVKDPIAVSKNIPEEVEDRDISVMPPAPPDHLLPAVVSPFPATECSDNRGHNDLVFLKRGRPCHLVDNHGSVICVCTA